MAKPRRRTAIPGLNVTPLIDVVFILLVFFMLATNFARYRLIGVDAPEETEVVKDSEGAVVILLKADGALFYDGEPAEPAALGELVGATLTVDPRRGFLVRPEKGVPFQRAVSAYDAARVAGARSVSFSKHLEGGRS